MPRTRARFRSWNVRTTGVVGALGSRWDAGPAHFWTAHWRHVVGAMTIRRTWPARSTAARWPTGVAAAPRGGRRRTTGHVIEDVDAIDHQLAVPHGAFDPDASVRRRERRALTGAGRQHDREPADAEPAGTR